VSEREIARSVYISEIPEGGKLEIKYRGKVIARREGEKKLEVLA